MTSHSKLAIMSLPDLEDYILNDDYMGEILNTNYDQLIKITTKMFKMYRTHKDSPAIVSIFNTKYMAIMRYQNLIVKKCVIIYVYNRLVAQNVLEFDEGFINMLVKKPSRSISGITSVTVLTSPNPDEQAFSCKHDCFYCPNESGQHRSYLEKEPAVKRANRTKFDPQKQATERFHTLLMNGHKLDKVEYIIEGGTFTEYPEDYLQEFICSLIYAANTYFDDVKRPKYTIDMEIARNATSKIKITGICCETRPDCIVDDMSWMVKFRELGITRVQLDVQHIYNDILKRVNRCHSIETSSSAIRILKNNCFKVGIHLMPDLPDSTPELDKEMFNYVYNSPTMRPDQVKIYPCSVVPWTKIEKWYKEGDYTPYAETKTEEFIDVIKYALVNCPNWIRIPRVIRDIPKTYISGCNKVTNLRQIIEDKLKEENREIVEIRRRECCKHPTYKPEDGVLNVSSYKANNGTDYFISADSKDGKVLFGFIRLRLCGKIFKSEQHVVFPELTDCALVRELHVYGKMTSVGMKSNGAQHTGIGKHLLRKAEVVARRNGYSKIAAISGIGVTNYYKKFGYTEQGNFYIKNLYTFSFIQMMSVGLLLMIVCPFICMSLNIDLKMFEDI